MKIKVLIPKVSTEFKFVSVTNLNKYFTIKYKIVLLGDEKYNSSLDLKVTSVEHELVLENFTFYPSDEINLLCFFLLSLGRAPYVCFTWSPTKAIIF